MRATSSRGGMTKKTLWIEMIFGYMGQRQTGFRASDVQTSIKWGVAGWGLRVLSLTR
jgi:hypothetical protein